LGREVALASQLHRKGQVDRKKINKREVGLKNASFLYREFQQSDEGRRLIMFHRSLPGRVRKNTCFAVLPVQHLESPGKMKY
jgi:hypothetical protein